jgi:type II secretory pathway component PulF
MTDRKNTVIVAGFLVILLLILSLPSVASMYSDEHQRATKLEAQLTKTEDKLNYYMWRESMSLGHSDGPEKYPGRRDD